MLVTLAPEDWVELGAGESWMFVVDTWIGPTMVTDCDTIVVLGATDAPGTWKIGLINTGVVVIN